MRKLVAATYHALVFVGLALAFGVLAAASWAYRKCVGYR